MIGTLEIQIELQPKIGDRDDFLIRAIGPGETDYSFPLAITRTIHSIWGGDSKKNAEELARKLLWVRGTAKAPPKEGFWFDSFNSGSTLKDTKNKIAKEGIDPFVKGGLDQRLTNLFGNDLFKLKEEINIFFVNKFNFEFFRSFESAFEDSQAIDDLNSPAKDHAHFVYRICILSVFIDHIQIRKEDEKKDTPSLKAFQNWLKDKINESEERSLTETFARVKDLRKQYPIHETYKINNEGERQLRNELKKAKNYFSLNGNYEEDWDKVSSKFHDSIQNIINSLK